MSMTVLDLRIEYHNFYCFPLSKFEVDLDNETFSDIKGHLNNLSESLTEYFPNLKNKDHFLAKNPFSVIENPTGYLAVGYESFIKIATDPYLKATIDECY